MAKKPQSFKVDSKKKIIILYTNVDKVEAEQFLIDYYLQNGYTPKLEEKKKGKTVDEMRKDMENDKAALDIFNAKYHNTDKEAVAKKEGGFHAACKYYNDWKSGKLKK